MLNLLYESYDDLDISNIKASHYATITSLSTLKFCFYQGLFSVYVDSTEIYQTVFSGQNFGFSVSQRDQNSTIWKKVLAYVQDLKSGEKTVFESMAETYLDGNSDIDFIYCNGRVEICVNKNNVVKTVISDDFTIGLKNTY